MCLYFFTYVMLTKLTQINKLCPELFWSVLGYFLFILPRSCLFQLVVVGYGFFHILYTKVKVHKARENLETLKKVKASKARKK